MKKIDHNSKQKIAAYINKDSHTAYKKLAIEMGISISELLERMIDNFYKFREYDKKTE